MKEDVFKKVVTDACRKYTFTELMKEKEKRKKGENLNYKKLNMQTNLVSDKIISRDAIFLFKIITQMLDVCKNYESKYKNNMTCQLCLSHTDTQQDIITCSALNTENRKITVRYSKNKITAERYSKNRIIAVRYSKNRIIAGRYSKNRIIVVR